MTHVANPTRPKAHRNAVRAARLLPRQAFESTDNADSLPAGRIAFVVTIIGLMGCGLALTLLLSTRSAEVSYQLATARERNQQLANECAVLRRQVEKADSAPELAAAAARLGMVPARDPAHLLVASDGSVKVIGKPKSAMGAPDPLLNPPSSPSNTSSVSTPMQFLFQPWTVSNSQSSTVAPHADVRAQGEQVVGVPLGSSDSGTTTGGRRLPATSEMPPRDGAR